MADLVRAMRNAAEESRAGTLESLRSDAKSAASAVSARSSERAAELRRLADEDVNGIREWSKAEIARIRAETDERVAARTAALERELGERASLAERELEAISAAVVAFEAQMDAFFTQLATIDDAGAFAAAAAALPEPPSLGAGVDVAAAAVEPAPEPMTSAPSVAIEDSSPVEDPSAVLAADELTGPDGAEQTPAAAHALTDDEAIDPRLAALGLAGTFAAIESEAAADAASEEPVEPVEEAGTDEIGSRLAALAPDPAAPTNGSAHPELDASVLAATESTRVVVVGLVNVASIASFKRHLARVRGVASVTVTSGRTDEFVFAATHAPHVTLRDVIPTLPGFAARVTGGTDGVVTVSARDPESDS